ncbi:MAG: hypothetical protein IJL02_05385 [Methanobrevibacter sp.]|uniref:hypothetical protein n=1 Tax=Methanobrevibacter sp. TaxID=66852 RepID=UPI0025F5EEE7|nr:hypothetical protein [Methanobrevibacter sp.]MBQ6099279.1 hypothetical protein [Methanobrevibacter sp.]
MAKKYPMTYDEFERRVMELLFEGMDSLEKKETEDELKELLEFDSDFIKNLYSSTCGAYDRDDEYPEAYFEDFLLKSRVVSTILMSL